MHKKTRIALLMILVGLVPMGYAEDPAAKGVEAVEPAAGPEEPTLLDQRVEQMKKGDDGDGEGEIIAGPAMDVQGREISTRGMKVLSNGDAAAYREAFKRARRGEAPNLKVQDEVLAGEVKGLYLMKSGASFDSLNSWLREYRDLPLASQVYDVAESKRARPKQICKTEMVTQKVKPKKGSKKKASSKKVKKKTCKTVGGWGPAPVVPLAVERREAKRQAMAAAREENLSRLSAEGRRVVGQSWRLRGQGKYADAIKVLLAPGARVEAGNDLWQGELVKIADYYHGQRGWDMLLKAAEPATDVKGPHRDDARWLAGYARYMKGDVEAAARHWEKLVQEEPVNGVHYSRAAWWGARALSQLKENSRAKALLEAGAKDPVGFYGQMCATKLGRGTKLDWSTPKVGDGDFAQLQRVKAAKRGLALAQIGEIDMAQRQLRAANEDLPYQSTRALAAVSVQMGLPATALYAGKQLKEQGEIMPAALFPLADDWNPDGGWKFDRALMLGIMRQESAFNPQIGSRVGAQGLMQIMPATGKYIARLTGQPLPDRADLHDPGINLALAQSYLKYLNGKLDGNLMLVVAAYNGGIGNVQRWLDRGVTPGHDPVLWLESIPFDETRDYVEKVFANYWLYQQRMNQTPWSLMALADGYWPLQWNGQRKTAGLTLPWKGAV